MFLNTVVGGLRETKQTNWLNQDFNYTKKYKKSELSKMSTFVHVFRTRSDSRN